VAVCLLLIGLLWTGEDAASAEAVLQRAEAAFQDGLRQREQPEEARSAFRKAASLYERLRRQGAHNPDLYRNQGNAHFLAGELPEAILAYWRGRQLAPRDAGLRAGQDYARSLVVRSRPNAFEWPDSEYGLWRLLGSWQLLCLVGMAVCLISSLLAALGRVCSTRLQRKPVFIFGIVTMLAGLLLGLMLSSDADVRRELSLRPLVVIAEDKVPLRTGNGLSYPARPERPPLSRGEEAIQMSRRGDWLQIKLPKGEVGWVNRSSVLVDE
jgi:hypothetical protein